MPQQQQAAPQGDVFDRAAADSSWDQAAAGTDQAAKKPDVFDLADGTKGDVWDAAAIGTKDTTDTGVSRNDDGTSVIVPREGESFSDTMARAAAAGKTVTPATIQSQTVKGVKDIPTVLGAAATAGIAGPAALAAPGEALGSALPKVTATVQGIGQWAQANPIKALIIYQQVIHPLLPKLLKKLIDAAPDAEK